MLSVQPNPLITWTTLFSDEHLMVVVKRAGIVTQPGKGHDSDSLLNGLFADEARAKKLQRLGAPRDFGLLHRLDRQTSGLLVVALNAKAYDGLRAQFEDRTVKKFYWAVTCKTPKISTGVIDKPIAESTPRDFTEQKLARITGKGGRGKPAATAYRVLSVSKSGPYEGSALIECRPLTGRLHQVRIHLNSINCDIYGDELYASPAVRSIGPRLALHSHRLAFTHPVTGESLDFSTPFPKDLRSLLTKLGLPRPDEGLKLSHPIDT